MKEVNTYDREKLYKEVWENSVVQVAKQYGVSDVTIHKVCKTLNVPVPPVGYWAKVRAGHKVKKPPLPPSSGKTVITGTRTSTKGQKVNTPSEALQFLTDEEKHQVLNAVQQISLPDEKGYPHKKLIGLKTRIKEWRKNAHNREAQPYLAMGISDEVLPRIFSILTALYIRVEALGGAVNEDLSLQIRGEIVVIDVSEGQDKVNHELTKQEARQLLEYQEAQRFHKYASEPRIRKYDNVYNGRLRFTICKRRHFRDTKNNTVESRLGDILIALYEESQIVRETRLAREEAQRKHEEEQRLEEEHRVRYNEEVKNTLALNNLASDYDMACKIRAYVSAVELSSSGDEKTSQWIEWAKKKADWYDPTIARIDEFFGKREHDKDESDKELQERGRYYRYWF